MQKYDNFPKNIYIYITNKKIKAVTGEGLIHLYIYIILIMFENKEIILFIPKPECIIFQLMRIIGD